MNEQKKRVWLRNINTLIAYRRVPNAELFYNPQGFFLFRLQFPAVRE
jgi:hypothetical protein